MKIKRLANDIVDRILSTGPGWAFVVLVSFIMGSQIVQPHRRVVKSLVMLVALIIMMRYETIYSLLFFAFLFPFPSGILITSTNVLLITILTLLWTVRAASMRRAVFVRTGMDFWVVVFLMANMLCFWNVQTDEGLIEGAKLLWRQLTATAFFYLIVTFVNDEKKLELIVKTASISAAFLALTAVIELLSPGVTIIPGWIGTNQQLGEGKLGYRLEGIRVGGAVASHGLLADYCTITMFFMGYLFVRARNVIEKLLWFVALLTAFIALLATANRGAFFGFILGLMYFMFVFRNRFNIVRYVMVVASIVAVFVVAQYMLEKYTIAASVMDRALDTHFKGGIPDTRHGAWQPPFFASFDHIFIGHGLYYSIDRGLGGMLWPHNAFIYYLYTLGLLGLGSFLGIVYKTFRMSLLYRSRAVMGTFAGTIMGLLNVQLIVHLFEQLRTDHQRNSDYVYIYIVWLLFGLVAATARIIRQKEKESRPAATTLNEASR